MEEEFRFHVDMETEKRIRAGMPATDARRAALTAFGGLERHRERMRDGRGRRWLEDFGADLRYAGRTLRRSPGFAVVAILTLALGIGATTAIFSVVNTVLIRPLPVDGLERIAVVRQDLPSIGLNGTQLATGQVQDLIERPDFFETVTAFRTGDLTLTGTGDATVVTATSTMGDFFRTFGLEAAAGRLYGAGASEPGNERVAVVSYGLWQQLGGGSADFVGSAIELEGQAYQVVGVLPPEFRYPRSAQLWIPILMDAAARENRGQLILTTLVRPRGPADPEQLAAQLEAVALGWHETYHGGGSDPMRLHATSFITYTAGDLRPVLYLLLAAVVLVLLIAVANVANLQLLRGTGRARELAVRTALGASRFRMIRQLTAENLVLVVAGGAGGVWLGTLTLDALERWGPSGELFLAGIPLDPVVLGLAGGSALLAAFLFGMIPALRVSAVEPQTALRGSTRGSSHGRERNRLLRSSVVVQVALAVVLLVGSGLMIRTLSGLLGLDPGFHPDGVTVMEMAIPRTSYADSPTRSLLIRSVLERVRATPGVAAAAFMWGVPLSGVSDSSPFEIPGVLARDGEPERHAEARHVSDGVFETLGIRLLAGRDFQPSDAGGPIVSIIDETFAEQFFPGQDPVGRQLNHYFGESTIIGVAARVDHDALADPPKATAYYTTHQFAYVPNGSLLVRSGLEGAELVPAVRAAVAQVDRAIPLYDIQTMEGLVARSLGPRRLAMLALGAFAALSLLLTALGIYGVMRYTTQERTAEIGVRMALGARVGHVVGMVVRQGLAMSVLGTVLGVAGALALTRFMGGILFGVTPTDPLTFAGVTVLLLGVSVLASWLPARKAARLNPVRALRRE